jgi:hypothetical protein
MLRTQQPTVTQLEVSFAPRIDRATPTLPSTSPTDRPSPRMFHQLQQSHCEMGLTREGGLG